MSETADEDVLVVLRHEAEMSTEPDWPLQLAISEIEVLREALAKLATTAKAASERLAPEWISGVVGENDSYIQCRGCEKTGWGFQDVKHAGNCEYVALLEAIETAEDLLPARN